MERLKIVKIGGHIINDETALNAFLDDFSKLNTPKILVHGGGKSASTLTQQMNIEVQIMNGRRITNAETLDIITMVYAGKINKTIVAKLQARNTNAIGFSGADGNSITAIKRPVETIDYGFVGDIQKVHIKTLKLLLNHGITPVFCAITHDKNGQLLNTNADTVASELAIAFANAYATELYYCFEKNGVLEDVNKDNSVIEIIDSKTYQTLLEGNNISEGMLPKLTNCFHAIAHQVKKVHIGKSAMLLHTNTKHTTIQK
ncbi:acetylglutamate kinase [Kordia algicida OT-1]|uniref:Acetylglutamate kinase n=1 Tax=Kordia algicida OT-1 TaxID=391587 RepID=A9DTR6_9FLAO|nr:acetylglutamate kinase [Kordia algicida]EDP96223.1 acetylglutamate kinase [Kordia algicida OT-1]